MSKHLAAASSQWPASERATDPQPHLEAASAAAGLRGRMAGKRAASHCEPPPPSKGCLPARQTRHTGDCYCLGYLAVRCGAERAAVSSLYYVAYLCGQLANSLRTASLWTRTAMPVYNPPSTRPSPIHRNTPIPHARATCVLCLGLCPGGSTFPG